MPHTHEHMSGDLPPAAAYSVSVTCVISLLKIHITTAIYGSSSRHFVYLTAGFSGGGGGRGYLAMLGPLMFIMALVFRAAYVWHCARVKLISVNMIELVNLKNIIDLCAHQYVQKL